MSEWILIVFFSFNSHVTPIQIGPFRDKLSCSVEGTSLMVENQSKDEWIKPTYVVYTRCVEVQK